jgi:chemotaxis protein CheC
MKDAPTWTDLEADALQELINVGVGRATAILSGMTGTEILLSVPELTFADIPTLETVLNKEIAGPAVSICQEFDGVLHGAATLVFMEDSSRQLVEVLVGDAGDVAASPELETEALAELGNIVLNSCLGEIADSLAGELKVDLPIVFKGDASKTLKRAGSKDWDAFLVRVTLQSKPSGIGGLIVFTLSSGHLGILRELINEFIGDALAS